MNKVLIGLVCIVIFVVMVFAYRNRTYKPPPLPVKENYGVVSGSIGPYRKEITECAARCNASDARSRLLGAYNIGCHQYCENLFTEKGRDYNVKGNTASSPEELKKDFQSTLDVCNEKCGVDVEFLENYSPSDVPPPFALMPDGNIVQPIDNPGCVNDCVGKYNVAKYCATMTCPYSLLPTDTCMERCIATRSVDNLNGSWTWDINNV